MSFTYENLGTNTYLVYDVKPDDQIDTMSLGMLTNNKILGLVPTVFVQMNEQKLIKYNVSSKVSVRQFFSGQVNKRRLIGVLNGIVNGLLSAEDYMIDINSLVLDLDYIFADVTTCEATMICLPIIGLKPCQNDLCIFFKNIMSNTQFDSSENLDYVAKIFNFLNDSSGFSIQSFKNLLDEIKNNKTNASPNFASAGNSASGQPRMVQPKPQYQNRPAPAAQVLNKQNSPYIAAERTIPQNNQPCAPKPNVYNNTPKTEQYNVNKGQKNSSDDENKVTLGDLLMHFSHERLEQYKSQKHNEKTNKNPNVKQTGQHKTSKKESGYGFSVPGQQNSYGFAVPGQTTGTVQQASLPKKPESAPALNNSFQPQKNVFTQPAAKINNQGNVNANVKFQMPQERQPQMQSQMPQERQPQMQPQMPYRNPSVVNPPVNFGETTVLGANTSGETTVLNLNNVQTKVCPYLIRKKNNERIEINKPVFRIGKERSYVDYFVSDNTAVSRSHANIIIRDGRYFIIDTNSTNHTYVNGSVIQSNTEVEITNGDRVRLGNEEFEFNIY